MGMSWRVFPATVSSTIFNVPLSGTPPSGVPTSARSALVSICCWVHSFRGPGAFLPWSPSFLGFEEPTSDPYAFLPEACFPGVLRPDGTGAKGPPPRAAAAASIELLLPPELFFDLINFWITFGSNLFGRVLGDMVPVPPLIWLPGWEAASARSFLLFEAGNAFGCRVGPSSWGVS